MLNLMLLLDLIGISILERGEFSKAIEQPIAKCDLLPHYGYLLYDLELSRTRKDGISNFDFFFFSFFLFFFFFVFHSCWKYFSII